MSRPILTYRRLIIALSTLIVVLGVLLAALLHAAAQPQRQPLSNVVASIAPMSNTTMALDTATDAVAYIEATNVRCSGVLVHPEWVATARHCVNTLAATSYPPSVQIRFGIDQSPETEPLTRAGHAVLYRYSDLALVRLDNPVTEIAPVDLIDNTPPAALAGFGFGPDPQKASRITTGDLHFEGEHEAGHHLAVLGERRVASGDSGGPILSDEGALFGLISYSMEIKTHSNRDGDASEFYAGVIGGTPAERDWVTDVTVDRILDDRTALTPVEVSTT